MVGWISPGAVSYTSGRLGVPPADVYGVATFYALLATEQRPPRVAHVCVDVPCRLGGVDALIEDLEAAVPEGATQDGGMWVRSPCLGRCDRAPAVFLQVAAEPDRELEQVDAAAVKSLLAGNPAALAAGPRHVGGERRLLAERPGYAALVRAIDWGSDRVLAELEASGLRGRGGAAFPTAAKWRAVTAGAGEKYVVANADESEPGTFKDRVLLETRPAALLEAMAVAGIVTGAQTGYVYLRGEYPDAGRRLDAALEAARADGVLGDDVLGSGSAFHVEVRRGAGAYICGEETALFNSIEGYRGEPRQKPPFPTVSGLFGRPTLVNNVETLLAVLDVIERGGASYAEMGTAESSGTKLFSVSGHVARPGVYEVEFGASVSDLIALAGGSAGTTRAVLLGGAAGSFLGPELWDMPLTFEAARDAGVSLGSGAVIVMNDTTDFGMVLTRIAEFFRDESCGQCVPCRVGTVRQEEALVRLRAGRPVDGVAGELLRLEEIDRAMREASICGLGHSAGTAVRSAVALGLVGGTP
jgi:NADH-quinone oxidoreductase subunit F